MTEPRKFPDINTSKDVNMPASNGVTTDEAPVHIPLSFIRWICYSVCFGLLLIPLLQTVWQMVCGGLILGWISSQLNAIINKK
jgi:hypothetical protein